MTSRNHGGNETARGLRSLHDGIFLRVLLDLSFNLTLDGLDRLSQSLDGLFQFRSESPDRALVRHPVDQGFEEFRA